MTISTAFRGRSAPERKTFSAISSANSFLGCPGSRMIDLTNSQEQDELMAWARGILVSELPEGRLLTSDLHTFPIQDLVKTLGALGWFELSAPETLGGGGLGIPDEALVWRELGRAIAPGPLLSTTVAAHVAANNGDEELAAAFG